jgi:hypothetical protein
MEGVPQRFIHRASGVRAHANYPAGVEVEAEQLRGGMQSASAKRNLGTTYIDLHHLYITQRAMLRNRVQAGEENPA